MKKTIKEFFIRDYRDYEPGKAWNGGRYAYYITLTPVGKKKYKVEYDTSSEFSYCSKYGQFQRCEDCPYYWEGECTAPDNILTKEKAYGIIRRYFNLLREGEKIIIEIEYSNGDTITFGDKYCY